MPVPCFTTGIEGLDEILSGGFICGRSYLVRGGPGTGKTTLGLHFLTAGAANGETVLFISLEESEANIRQNASSSGFDVENVSFLDLSPTSDFFAESQSYDIFSSAEVEREPITVRIVDKVRELKPSRVFLDPLTQFRYLSSDLFQFRKQVLSFLRFLTESGATVLFTSEGSTEAPDDDLQFMADGVILLEAGSTQRKITVTKARSTNFMPGSHSMKLSDHGFTVFPRMTATGHVEKFVTEPLPSGIPELDELLGGGLNSGTVTLISGPSGVGKTTVGFQFMKETSGRGERSVVFSFEEEPEIMLRRCEALNIPVRKMIEKGTLEVIKIEPLQYSADEISKVIRYQVEEMKTRVVMIDSVIGYSLTLQGTDLVTHLHSLCKYLQKMGVAVFLISEMHTVTGTMQVSEHGISYLADSVLFLRYLELRKASGAVEVRKAIGILKKRLGDFDKTLRELEFTKYGLKVNRPMARLNTILGGLPAWEEVP